MEFNQVANDDHTSNIGWLRGQELALQLELVTFFCLLAAFIEDFRLSKDLALAGAIALILKQLGELIYHGVCQYPFLIPEIVGFVILWCYVLFLKNIFS